MERCISFIEENAPECVKSNAFLNLPKEALIKLISSDNLRLEEKDVWRCSLAWAKQRAGVTQPTAHWAEEERARVVHHLTPLMQHVRLLHIDSVVFAEEVEPTGAVPMELSLKRYKSAALHAAPHAAPPAHDARRRSQPRLATNFFVDSVILRQDKITFQSLLNTWCGAPSQSWRLVFRASTHGFSAHAFHSRCDAIAPVLLLVQLPRGEIIGGFSTSGWTPPAGGETTAGGYIAAERALLFTQDPPALYPLMKNSFALCYHSECGPIFGAGADLLVAHDAHAGGDSYSNLHSYGDGAHASLVPDYNFSVRDYELFTC